MTLMATHVTRLLDMERQKTEQLMQSMQSSMLESLPQINGNNASHLFNKVNNIFN